MSSISHLSMPTRSERTRRKNQASEAAVAVPVPGSPHDTGTSADLEELAARHLEGTGRFRILRRIAPRPVAPAEQALVEGRRVGILVDVETTGLDRDRDEVVEFGAVSFTFDDSGAIHDVLGVFSGLRQPTRRLASEITRLTGITDAMLEGRSIDPEAVARFVGSADLVIAHNAAFDRPFCEKHFDVFRTMRWGCSLKDVSWGVRGSGGLKLGQLLAARGLFHNGHRAVDDCLALLEILSAPGDPNPPMRDVVEAAGSARIEIRAERTPFDAKDLLKKRGYRWSDGRDGQPKAWVVEVPEARYISEIQFLHVDVYRTTFTPVWRRLDATCRYR